MPIRLTCTTALFALTLLAGCASEGSSAPDETVENESTALGSETGGGAGAAAPHGMAPQPDDDKAKPDYKKKKGFAWGHFKNKKLKHFKHKKPHKPMLTCDHVRCAQGTHCELQAMACGKAAQWKTPVCVPDDVPPPPTGPQCGGIAGLPCPGEAECVDDPSDDCDPMAGGADCGGVCACNVIALCVQGYVWNGSPDVCACVPDLCPLTDCPDGTTCEMVGSEAVCVANEPTPPSCAAVLCPVGSKCVEVGGMAKCVPFTGEICGDRTCDLGEVCCNASCGICTPPDGVCIQVACDE